MKLQWRSYCSDGPRRTRRDSPHRRSSRLAAPISPKGEAESGPAIGDDQGAGGTAGPLDPTRVGFEGGEWFVRPHATRNQASPYAWSGAALDAARPKPLSTVRWGEIALGLMETGIRTTQDGSARVRKARAKPILREQLRQRRHEDDASLPGRGFVSARLRLAWSS